MDYLERDRQLRQPYHDGTSCYTLEGRLKQKLVTQGDKVIEQARRYVQGLRRRHPEIVAQVVAFAYTNERGLVPVTIPEQARVA